MESIEKLGTLVILGIYIMSAIYILVKKTKDDEGGVRKGFMVFYLTGFLSVFGLMYPEMTLLKGLVESVQFGIRLLLNTVYTYSALGIVIYLGDGIYGLIKGNTTRLKGNMLKVGIFSGIMFTLLKISQTII